MSRILKIKARLLVVFILLIVFSAAGAGWLGINQKTIYIGPLILLEVVFFVYFLNSVAAQISRESIEDLHKFKLAVDNASDQIIITDTNGIVVYLNKATGRITGYSVAEGIGKKVGVLWGRRMEKSFYENLWKTIKIDKKPFIAEIKNQRKNGEEYTAMLNIDPILDEQKKLPIFFVAIERDISKSKAVEQMKTDFISFASHQLRTPLTVIKWNTEMLRNGDAGDLTAEQKRYLTEIESGERRMALLISSLLNISRLEAEKIKIEPKPTDIATLISSVISELTPYASAKNCAVIFNKPAQSPPLIELDPILLKQVILNLLNNATHYSKPQRCKVEVDFKEIEGYYQIDVVDEGIGIPASAQDKVFDKFFRADNAVKADTDGTGLGLYLVKLIIERSGGKIWFESTEGKGSAFHFTIPKSGMKKMDGEKKLSV